MKRPPGHPRRIPVPQIETAIKRRQAGETWYKIARDYGVSWQALRASVRRVLAKSKPDLKKPCQIVGRNTSDGPARGDLPANLGVSEPIQSGNLPFSEIEHLPLPLVSEIPANAPQIPSHAPKGGPSRLKGDAIYDLSGRVLYQPPQGVQIVQKPRPLWSPAYADPVVVYSDFQVRRLRDGALVGWLPPGREIDLPSGEIAPETPDEPGARDRKK